MKRALIRVALVILMIAFVVPVQAADGVDWLIIQKRQKAAEEDQQKAEEMRKGTIPFDQLYAKEDLKKKEKIPFDQLYAKNGSKEVVGVPTQVLSDAQGTVYTVVGGDTVSKVFARFCDKGNWQTISTDNNLDQNNTIYVGQKLVIRESLLKQEYQNPMLKLEQKVAEIASLNVEVKNLGGKVKKVSEELVETKTENSKLSRKASEAEKSLDNFRIKIVEIINKQFPDVNLESGKSLEEIAAILEARFISLKEKAKDLNGSLDRKNLWFAIAIAVFVLLLVLACLGWIGYIRANKKNTELRSITRLARIKVHINHEGKDRTFAFYCPMDKDNRFDISPLNWSGTSIVLSLQETKKAMRFYLNRYLTDDNVVEVKERMDKLFASGRLVELDPLSESFVQEVKDEK